MNEWCTFLWVFRFHFEGDSDEHEDYRKSPVILLECGVIDVL